ncbi:MAG: CsbD family protein [Desulfobacterales bacterium]|nr:CsbD family protein [Desulfobacterales bacterium]
MDEHTIGEMAGRVKEAAGDLTDDGKLKREGQADQFKARVKRGVDDAADAVKDALDPKPARD